jgi:hypothetical protein
LLSTGAGFAARYIPAKTYKIPVSQWSIDYATEGPNHLDADSKEITLVKPHFIKGGFGIAALAALVKLGVKLKRAKDYNKNIISFIISDAWAKK